MTWRDCPGCGRQLIGDDEDLCRPCLEQRTEKKLQGDRAAVAEVLEKINNEEPNAN